LDKVLEGAKASGAEVDRLYIRDLKIEGCLECGGCDKTGRCVIKDDMASVYPRLEEADLIVLACPIFFYGPPAQTKALIDRSQALWSKRNLRKDGEARKRYDSGKGYLLAVGASRGKKIFEGTELAARYFFDAMDKSYEGGVFFRGLEKSDALKDRPEALEEAYGFGKRLADPHERS
jgi:multimeric flavodoxin WrbA